MIGLVDLGLGNIKSLTNAFNFIGYGTCIIQSAEDVDLCDGIVLPGVGAFGKGCEALDSAGLRNKIRTAVLEQDKPILGICLGMQLLVCTSEETPGAEGLSLISGNSHVIHSDTQELKVPHIGWNCIVTDNTCSLFDDITDPVFYFLHSYYVEVDDSKHAIATTNYGNELTVALCSDKVYGVQFHPEKSQESGLQVLRNFCKIVGSVK